MEFHSKFNIYNYLSIGIIMMNRKQLKIYSTILETFNLNPKTFIQHRNLTEFKHFKIERVNPTHRIILYGILKNKHKKKETCKNLIKVGELLLISGLLMINLQIFFIDINLIILLLNLFFLDCFLFYLFGNLNILGVLNDYRN